MNKQQREFLELQLESMENETLDEAISSLELEEYYYSNHILPPIDEKDLYDYSNY